MKEEPFEEFLKKVIPATKEEREHTERAKNKPPPTPEEVETQLRAAGAWRGRAPGECESAKSGHGTQQGS